MLNKIKNKNNQIFGVGKKNMNNKQKILEIIISKSCPISVKDILNIIGTDINKTTVYRNIEKLLNTGIILEDFGKNGEKIYSLKQTHHHHFICDICEKKENIGCFINFEIEDLENKFGFKVKNHSFVLNGICKKCL
ncbi:transcriptional repressor [Candidatus Gracilibacteria bacterium]|nr:transcriptional repressor [Candidatus Gracilibacteria bacterium]